MSRFQSAKDEIGFLKSIGIPEIFINLVIEYNDSLSIFKKRKSDIELFTDFKFIEDPKDIPFLDIEKDIVEFAFYNANSYQTVTVTAPNPSIVTESCRNVMTGLVAPNQHISKLIKIIEKRIINYSTKYPKTVLSIIQNNNELRCWAYDKFIFECMRNNPLLILDVIDNKNMFRQQIDNQQTLILVYDYIDDEQFKSIMLELDRPNQSHLYLHKFKNKIKLIQDYIINTLLFESASAPFLILEDFQWEFIKLKRFT